MTTLGKEIISALEEAIEKGLVEVRQSKESSEERMKQKTIDDHFIDWMNENISYGYGSGEPHTIPALRAFFLLCSEGVYSTAYQYERLEEALNSAVVWLLINILCRAGIIEYGTSPRYGWLTPEGIKLRNYMLSKTEEELILLVCGTTENSIFCSPDYCNCGDGGYSEKKLCFNPFW